MRLEGQERISSSQQHVWDLLNDPDVLARITPGCIAMDVMANGRYAARFDVRVGVFNDAFTGDISVTDRVSPDSFHLTLHTQTTMGEINAEGQVALVAQDDETLVKFKGAVELGGVLATMGEKMSGTLADGLIKQVLDGLRAEADRDPES